MTSKVLTREEIQAIGEKITKAWADKGQVIEGGWQAFLMMGLQGASDVQKKEMRKAYYLGAQHLYSSIMVFLEEGSEPTEKDLQRMMNIHMELEKFGAELKAATMN